MDVLAERLYPSAHFKISQAAVAQWIEYWPPKPRVVGSIPASRTIFFHNALHCANLNVSLPAKRFLLLRIHLGNLCCTFEHVLRNLNFRK